MILPEHAAAADIELAAMSLMLNRKMTELKTMLLDHNRSLTVMPLLEDKRLLEGQLESLNIVINTRHEIYKNKA